jgi:hypothetical protein
LGWQTRPLARQTAPFPRRPPNQPFGQWCSRGRPADNQHMKLLRILLIAFAVVIVGTIASAAPRGVHSKPTPRPVAVSDSPGATETEASEAEATTSDQTRTAQDFSGCVGLIGLENAICRHEALIQVKPGNPGLTNSLTRLQANAAAHAARQAAKTAGTRGDSGSYHNSRSHGPWGS